MFRFLFWRSKVVPLITNSLRKVSHASYWPVIPGKPWSTPYLMSSFWTSASLSLVFKYFFSYSAPAPRRLLLMHLSGLPSMLMRTRFERSARRGFRSARSLFDTFRVFNCFRSEIMSGRVASLLLWTSSIVRLGARSKFANSSILL